MNTHNITDKRVLKEIEKTNNSWLTERMLSDWTEEERENRTDMELLSAEVDWMLDLYTDSSSLATDLKTARQILRKTKYGKSIMFTFTLADGIKFEFTQDDIQWAKDTVNEYNRFCSLVKRLDKITKE